MRITFWGAVRTVTGSLHEIQVHGRRYLLDCGLYQGRRQQARERNSHFPFRPTEVDAVILSHAHIDHSGNLPTLVKQGYAGPIYATPATVDLCDAMLRDSGYLQEKDAEFLNKRRRRRKALDPSAEDGLVEPLYTMDDAAQAMKTFRPVPIHTPTVLDDMLSFETYDAGHMLGSTAVLLHYHRHGKRTRLVFSGDIGRPGLGIVRDPEPLPRADYLILESTYGDRLHKSLDAVADKLADTINRTARRGGKIIVPAFAVGRTQQLVLLIHQLLKENKIPQLPVFVDSPLAVDVTAIFRKHAECFDDTTREFLLEGEDPFGFASLRYVREAEQSKALNDLRGPFIVISASGMCEAGRILHHLRHNIEDPRNTILITGFQAEHTLGRKIVEKQPEVPIFGEPFRLRAEVVKLNELSGHADQHELLQWLQPLAPSLKKVFLVHGELSQAAALAKAIEERYRLATIVPERGQSFELE
ncbi:MAG: MBL fold metallo-hydrolase [Bryobacterales bacterium]|nr:MBL fold metallo-hydrolase [Bryobacterales bacterium]